MEISKMTSLEMVKELHEKFLAPVEQAPTSRHKALRLTLLEEELDELREALEHSKIAVDPEVAALVLDALCDLQVVLDGAFLALGFWRVKDQAMIEVHRSNMSKLGADGKPIFREDGKFLKGPNFTPPNLVPLVKYLYASELYYGARVHVELKQK